MSSGYQSPNNTIELVVNCNDLFWWGTADSEHCGPDELQSLYDRHKADPRWGAMIWCFLHRKLQPQVPVREKMQQDGAWTEELAALPEPSPS